MAETMPKWLNKELLEKVLKNSERDESIRVIEMSSKAAASKGDNYTSEVLRVIVNFTRKKNSKESSEQRSLIVKVAHIGDGMLKEMIEEIDAVNTEIKMMTSTLVEMEKLLGDTKLCGKCLYGQDNPPAVIIEDLAESGFRLADRQAGLDLPHALLAIRNLAKFHASSVAIVEKNPECIKDYNKGVFFDTDGMLEWKRFAISGLESLAKAVETWPELGKKYQDKLIKFSKDFFAVATKKTALDKNEFNVINHGDFWINNMFFHYDKNNQVDGHIFLDFQISVYKSPAIDLNYFLYASLSEDVLINHREQLLKEYLSVLTSTMKRIGCKTLPPSMADLERILHKYEIYSLFATFICLPIMSGDKKDAKSIEEMTAKDGAMDGVKNPLFLKRVSRRLKIWDEMGLLDLKFNQI